MGVLRKQGVAYNKKSLQFKDNITEVFPSHLPDNFPYDDLQHEKFQQGWHEVTPRTLDRVVRTLQGFARKHMLCWIIANDRRTDMYEELECIQDRLQGDMERLTWEKEDMQQKARLEIQLELQEQEDAPAEECNQVNEDLAIIEALQEEIRTLKVENKKIKKDSKSLKKDNKQLVSALKSQAVEVEIRKFKVAMFEGNHQLIHGKQDQCLPNKKTWYDNLDQTNTQWQLRRKQGHAYRDACLKIMEQVKVRHPKKKVSGLMLDIMCQGFASQGTESADLSSIKASLRERTAKGRGSSPLKTAAKKRPSFSWANASQIRKGTDKKPSRSIRRINSMKVKSSSSSSDKKESKERKKPVRCKTDPSLCKLTKMKKAAAARKEQTDASGKPTGHPETKTTKKGGKLKKQDSFNWKAFKKSPEAEASASEMEAKGHKSFDWSGFHGSYDWTSCQGDVDHADLHRSFDWTSHAADPQAV